MSTDRIDEAVWSVVSWLAAFGSEPGRAAITPTLAIFKTAQVFHDTLLGGCTGVRDASGVDLGMKQAVEQGLA